jgi:hypothetical protein
MEFRIWVETHLAGHVLERELAARVERPASGIGPEEFGLMLEEGKKVLRRVEARIIQTQVDVLSAAHKRCFRCGGNQRVKDLRTRKVRTVFGTVQVSCRRYFRCKCRGGKKAVIWPLPRHQLSGTSPELQYLYATWGSRVTFASAA